MSHADEELDMEVLSRRNFLSQTVVASCACAAACVFAAGEAEGQTTPKKPGTGGTNHPNPGAQPKNPDGTPIVGKTTVGPLASFAKQPDGVYDKFAKAPTAFLVVINDGKIYALSSVCTHKKRLIHTYEKDSKQAFCPGHSSLFDLDGTPTPVTPDGDKSPAREPLPRHGISVNPKGMVVVDTSKVIKFEQRDEEGAFIDKKAATPPKDPAADKPKTGTSGKKTTTAK
jgi:nitrite reductase/ring-hydroxylating ferredoxin subunit